MAVVHHGAPTPSAPNIIGGTSPTGALSYLAPITIRFFDPTDPSRPGVTDFVRVRGDLTPLGTGTVTLQAFAFDDSLLGSVTVPDVSPGPVVSLSFSAPGIHRAVVSGSSGTVGFDNVEFHRPRRAATWRPYGSGCAGALGVPSLSLAPGALPVSGGNLALQVSAVPAGAAVMILGFSDTQAGPFQLPLPLGAFGAPGCHLLTEIVLTQPMLASGNLASWSLGVPAVATLVGLCFFDQALVLDPGANPIGFVLSNAGAATIGA